MLDTSIRINRAIARSNALYREAASRLHVKYPELIVLYAFLTLGECTQRDICDTFGLNKQTVNHAIRELQQQDMLSLEVRPSDKREKLAQLNERGQKYARDVAGPLLELEKRVYEQVGQREMDAMSVAMEDFNAAFEAQLGNI